MGSEQKDLIQGKADEIALERYDLEFYELTEVQRDEVWESAIQDCRESRL